MVLDKTIVKQFIDFVVGELGISSPPRIVLTQNKSGIKTTAVYRKRIEIKIYTKGRHLVDVLRSLAHELVHHWQLEQGKYGDEGIQDVGGEIEDEANAVAGQLIKKFAYNGNMKIYEIHKKTLEVLSEAKLRKQLKQVDNPLALPLAQFLDVSPYTLEEKKYKHYTLTQFSTEDGEEYAIGTDEEADASWDEYLNYIKLELKNFISPNNLSYYIDEDCAKRFANDEYSYYDELIREDPSNWIREEPEQLTDYANDEIKTLESQINEANAIILNNENEISELSETGDTDRISEIQLENEGLQEEIDGWLSDIEDIKTDTSNSDYWEYSEDQIEAEINTRLEDISDDLIGYLEGMFGPINRAFDEIYTAVERCIDEDEVIADFKRNGSRGDDLSHYDGDERTIRFDGITYYIYRVG